MEEILHQLIDSLSHHLQGFIHPRWCRISSINSSTWKMLVKDQTSLLLGLDLVSMAQICFDCKWDNIFLKHSWCPIVDSKVILSSFNYLDYLYFWLVFALVFVLRMMQGARKLRKLVRWFWIDGARNRNCENGFYSAKIISLGFNLTGAFWRIPGIHAGIYDIY